ncbi:MAG: FAD-dependent monooxygenase [Nitrosomonas sp.]
MINDQYDIIIIGGGPVGMALAIALSDTNRSVLLLEAHGVPEEVGDPRPLALSYGSHLILQRLGVWNELTQKTPITHIHISNRDSLGQTNISPEDADVPVLGFVVSYFDLFRALHKKLTEKLANNIDYIAGATVTQIETSANSGTVYFDFQNQEQRINARMLVLADGGKLTQFIPEVTYQTHDYKQWAVIANVKAQQKQRGIAYERFTPDGPIALLPNKEDFALIWTAPSTKAQAIHSLDDDAFLESLYHHFGSRLGRFISTGTRSTFPLMLKYASSIVAQRIVLIGNAAQTLHPVAGQGFNLGLRDAYELSREISNMREPNNSIGTTAMLSKYREKRKIDSYGSVIFTNSLIKLFSNEDMLLKYALGFGLAALDCIPPVKKFVARRMIFGARG